MANEERRARPKILFFDINETLLDLTELKKTVETALHGRADLVPLWWASMLHYSLVSTVAGQFKPLREIGVAAMMMLARSNNLDLDQEHADAAIQPILSAPPYPDVPPSLRRLREEGFHMIVLTNSFQYTMETQMKNSGLADVFHMILSAEEAGIYKPHRDIYRWAASRVGKWPTDCMMIAAHGWDIAGALWNGMRAAFISRPGQELYPLAPVPEIIEPDLEKIADRLIRMPA